MQQSLYLKELVQGVHLLGRSLTVDTGVCTGMTFPSPPVSTLHSSGAVTLLESTCSYSKACVSFSETLVMYKEWKCGCGVSSMCGVLVFSGTGISALWPAVSMA